MTRLRSFFTGSTLPGHVRAIYCAGLVVGVLVVGFGW